MDNDGRPGNMYSTLRGPFDGGIYKLIPFLDGKFLAWDGWKVAALDSEGKLLPDLLRSLPPSDTISLIQKVPSGGILIGQSSPLNGLALSVLHPNGSMGPSFSVPFDSWYQGFIQGQSDGKLVIGGNIPRPEFKRGVGVMRLFPDGRVDDSFKPIGVPFPLDAVVVQPDDKILLGGKFGLIRLLKDGAVDPDFQRPANAWDISFIFLDSQNRIFTEGLPPNGTNLPPRRFWFHPDGTLDQVFTNDSFFRIICGAAEPNGKFWLGGIPNENNGAALLHFFANGDLDPSFTETNSFTQSGRLGAVRSVIPQENGDLIVGGGFTEFSGIRVNGLVRLKGERPFELRLAEQQKGEMELRIPTTPGRSFLLEQSYDLRNWSGALTNDSNAFEWRVPLRGFSPSQFFRVSRGGP